MLAVFFYLPSQQLWNWYTSYKIHAQYLALIICLLKLLVTETVLISPISILGKRYNSRPVCDHIEMEKSVKTIVDMKIAEWNEITSIIRWLEMKLQITQLAPRNFYLGGQKGERFCQKYLHLENSLISNMTTLKPSKFCLYINSWVCKLYTPWPRWPPGSGRYCSSDLMLSRGPRPPTYISSMPSELKSLYGNWL